MSVMKRIAAAVLTVSISGVCSTAAFAQTAFPVSRSTVYPGDTITADMLVLKPLSTMNGVSSFYTDSTQLIGKMARRTIVPGMPILKIAIREPYLVFQGKSVNVVYQTGGIIISQQAVAMESGSIGELISARNPESGLVIHGVVQSNANLLIPAS